MMPETAYKKFPCKGCGGNMEFQPGESSLKCPYCGVANEPPEEAGEEIVENDFLAVLSKLEEDAPTSDVIAVSCSGCGAEVSLGQDVVSETCPYCGATIIAEQHSVKEIKPQYILPFSLEKEQALTNFQKWIKSRWFLPGNVKKFAQRNEIKGVYVPYWTYDSNTTTQYMGRRGDYYYVTETYTEKDSEGKTETKTREVRKTRWTFTSGVVSDEFDDLLVLASTNLPEHYARELEPWDLEKLVDYDDSFLSGFITQSYSVSVKDGFSDAKEQMAPEIRRSIELDIGGDEQKIDHANIDYHDITFKHILLPVWISSYKYNDKIYRFLINARTGEVQGERPWSIAKILLFIFVIVAIIVGVGFWLG
jgi:predicted RNA-binding Zn-ribbon protein involved in translation (DUF1610 family)